MVEKSSEWPAINTRDVASSSLDRRQPVAEVRSSRTKSASKTLCIHFQCRMARIKFLKIRYPNRRCT